jgi:hypothetical protein
MKRAKNRDCEGNRTLKKGTLLRIKTEKAEGYAFYPGSKTSENTTKEFLYPRTIFNFYTYSLTILILK